MAGSTKLDSIDAFLSKMIALTDKLKTDVEKVSTGVEKLQAIYERSVEMKLELYPGNQMLNSTLQEETETEVSMEVQSQEFDSNPHIFDREFEVEEAKAEASIDEMSQELHSNPQRIEGFGKHEECCESLVSNSEETEESSQENDLNSQSLKVIPQIPSFTKNSILEVATKDMFELDEVSVDRSAHQVFVEMSDKGVHLGRSLVDWKFLSKIDNTELISSLKGSHSYPITFDPGGVFGLAIPTVKNFPSCGQEIDPLVEIEDVKWCMSSGMVLEMDDSCSQPPNLFLEIASFCTKLNKYTSLASTDAQELEFNKLEGVFCHHFKCTRCASILCPYDRGKGICYCSGKVSAGLVVSSLSLEAAKKRLKWDPGGGCLFWGNTCHHFHVLVSIGRRQCVLKTSTTDVPHTPEVWQKMVESSHSAKNLEMEKGNGLIFVYDPGISKWVLRDSGVGSAAQ